MNNKFEYIKTLNLNTEGMSLEEKQKLEKLLKDRGIKEGVETCETLKQTIEKAKMGIYDELFIPNVISYVYGIGCCSKCVIKTIKELREKDVNIHFIQEDIDTRNRRNDLLLGSLIGEAVYEMYLEQQKQNKK